MNPFYLALNEAHPDGVEQRRQRRTHVRQAGLMKPRPQVQNRRRRKQRDFYRSVRPPRLSDQASRPEGTPQTGEAGTSDQDSVRHGRFLLRLNES